MIVIWSPCQHRQLEIHIEKTNKTKQKYLQKKDFQEKKSIYFCERSWVAYMIKIIDDTKRTR